MREHATSACENDVLVQLSSGLVDLSRVPQSSMPIDELCG